MNTLRLITAALLLTALGAFASPVYLRCTLPAAGGAAAVALEVVVDEPSQRVIMSVPGLGAPAQVMASTFSPARVEFAGRSQVRYIVDRSTLAFTRAGLYPAEGTCALAPPANRKF